MPTPHSSPVAGAPAAQGTPAAPDDRYLRTIADAIPAAAIYLDGAQRCRHANAAAAAWFDLDATAMRGRAAADLFGASHTVLQPYLARALHGEEAHSGHPLALPGLGRRASVIARPDRVDSGNGGGSSGGDVRGMVLLLIESGEPGDSGAPPESFEPERSVDAAGIALRPGETIGLRISDIMGEEAFATLRRYVDAALDGRARQVEVRMPAAGDEDAARMMVLPERDEHGQVNGLVAAINDIARLRRTEEKLHRREQEFKTLVENSPDIITRFDCDMRHLYVNPAVERAFGKPASAYLGKTIAETGSPPQVVDTWEKATRRVFASGAEERFDYAQQIDGRVRHFSARLIPEFDRGGNIESLLGITYDITDRTRMENERAVLLARERSARIQAETAARARDEFLAIVSHELRAPLNGIQSWAHVLESYAGDSLGASMARRALQGIRTGVAQQVRLIEDLLDVTRMMSGRLRLVRQPFTLLPV
ncbi:MAG: PAS domain-containing protein, partial [Burkholderiaceae bacterium]